MMLEPEKLQNRGKQGWPDAGKGTGHKGDKKVNTLVRHKWTPIEQFNALGGKHMEFSFLRMCCSHCHKHIYICTSSCMHSGGCSRSLPRCATGNGLQTTSLAACSGSPYNARIH